MVRKRPTAINGWYSCFCVLGALPTASVPRLRRPPNLAKDRRQPARPRSPTFYRLASLGLSPPSRRSPFPIGPTRLVAGPFRRDLLVPCLTFYAEIRDISFLFRASAFVSNILHNTNVSFLVMRPFSSPIPLAGPTLSFSVVPLGPDVGLQRLVDTIGATLRTGVLADGLRLTPSPRPAQFRRP